MSTHPRLELALRRNLMELNNAILKRRAYNKLLFLKSSHGLTFFRVAAEALHNDLYAGAHRALDHHKDSATFWYIKNIAPDLICESAGKLGVSLERIEILSNKLRPIRDQEHFHIDRAVLNEPEKPWREADITGNQFIWLTESAHAVLREAMLKLTGEDHPIPEYDGDDIEPIIRAYVKEHPSAPVSI